MSYEKLVPSAQNKDQGDFVKGLQGATGTGFADGTHVHKDWWAKTASYDTVMEKVQATIADQTGLMNSIT